MAEDKDKVNWGPEIHSQFQRQAKWTEYFRNNAYRHINLSKAKKILEVGCGTGVITAELRKRTPAKIVAIDHDPEMIAIAEKNVLNVDFQLQDVEKLSLKDKSFDAVICHYLLLWVKNPVKGIVEMSRVCKKKGYVVALAEPDYGAWIEYPEFKLGQYHSETLINEGADPYIGRKLKSLFESADLETTISVIAQVWDKESLSANIEEEWKRVYEAQLISSEDLKRRITMEKEAISLNTRMIFMPVFTSIGRKR